ncbi:orexin receptor type 2 [Drosophila innubila]|uniref:orexin receptor type 2 n=1 Tax=Drosophila innubila TaxID=198719 RepID=UPI00148DC63F|nr:orexin receptor type 2 [Drosophila innubila]
MASLPQSLPVSLLQTLNVTLGVLPYPIFPIANLCQIHAKQRSVFIVLVCVLFVIAFIGNIGTLYVNSRRKLRPFFRICLIALACSDLLYSMSFTTAYVAHFNAKYLELWVLGRFMCSFVPFVNTATIMFSSLILVAIALDRYMAIRRAALTIWNPSWLYCGMCIAGIWLTSVICAAPLFIISEFTKVYLQPTDELVVSELQLASMCLGMSGVIGVYNVILLSLIFLPCIVGFVFLNATIARRLWQRRHHHHQQQRQQEGQHKGAPRRGEPRFVYLLSKPETTHALMTAFSVAASLDLSINKLTPSPPPSPPQPQTEFLSPAAAARVARHRRMVHVVILMMAAFICLRLPAWIFLILRLYGTFSSPVDWLLYFSFGLLNLTSSALNPLFYTFLTQTIRCLSRIKLKLHRLLCCLHKSESESQTDAAMPKESSSLGKCCLCCGVQVTWQCYAKTAKMTPSSQSAVPDQPLPTSTFTVANDNNNLPHFGDLTSEIFTIYNENSLSTLSSASIKSSS